MAEAWSFMLNAALDHLDECGEVDCTGLAETTANVYELYEDDPEATIPEWVFDLALEAKDKALY
jgi:hypothetical protein